MGWFDIGGQGGGQGGGINTGTVAQKNFSQAGFNLKDGDGKVITNVAIDPITKVGKYTKVLTKTDIGQKGITARFTGDHIYAAGPLDSFSTNISDASGLNSTTGQKLGVDKIVAGPGIYISAPNGQGVVTVAAEPLNLTPFTHDLWDVSWSTTVYNPDGSLPFGAVGQFTAVGYSGSSLRSRDGHNWVQMDAHTSTSIYGVSSELNPDIPSGHLEYIGVGPTGTGFYGLLGSGTDSMNNVGQLQDQNGPITEDFNSTRIFPNASPIIPNIQFTGGITQDVIINQGASTATGMPLYDTYNAVVMSFIIPEVTLQKSTGKAATIYSSGADDVIKIKTHLYCSDIRGTPGTPIEGQYPFFYIDPITHQTVLVSFPNGHYYFSPYIKVYLDGTLVEQGFLNNGNGVGWAASTFHDATILLTIGTAGYAPLNIGHHTLTVAYSAAAGDSAAYVYTTIFTVAP